MTAFCVLFLLPTKPSDAQRTEKKKLATIEWEKLEEGTTLLKLWQLEGAKAYPQVSVFRVSNETYLKFFQDPEGFLKFVNENNTFPVPARRIASWVSLSSFVPKEEVDGWVLTCVHGRTSLFACSALPQLSAEPPKTK